MLKLLFLFPIVCSAFACGHNAGKSKEGNNEIPDAASIGTEESGLQEFPFGPFDTIELSGGYRVIATREPDDSVGVPYERYALWRDTMISELGGWSEGLLRYDAMDAGEYFLSFHNSRGSGNPRHFDLIAKRTGEALLAGKFIGLDSSGRYLLYGSSTMGSDEETMVLFDIDAAMSGFYEYPSDLTSVSPTYNIALQSVGKDRFIIEYLNEEQQLRRREYERNGK